MRVSYAVVWRVGNGPQKTGRLELLSTGFRLEPLSGSAASVRGIPYESLTGVRVGRDKDHPDGRRTLVVERQFGPTITITSAAQPNLMREMFERLAARQFATANEAVHSPASGNAKSVPAWLATRCRRVALRFPGANQRREKRRRRQDLKSSGRVRTDAITRVIGGR